MMKLTNQTKRGQGVNWFLNEKRLLKLELKKTSFPKIISQIFDKPIFNQSPFTKNPLLKFFFQKYIFFNLK